MRSLFVPSCGIVVSTFLFIVGIFFLFIFPSLFQFFTNREFRLTPTSQSFKHWRKTPLPITLDFYLFNWTNPGLIAKEKPVFHEMGPYRFYEKREKVNVTWNENGTITYRQTRVWHFNEQESVGPLDEKVTTINGVTLTAAYQLRHAGWAKQQSISMAMAFTKQEISVTHSVRDLLFDGYTNDLMTIGNSMPSSLTPVTSPFDKFAYFYQRNGSYTFDGLFNMDTGSNDMSNLGRVRTWNYGKHTGFYPGSCGEVQGYSGDLFPPGRVRRDTRLDLFSQDLCRQLTMEYQRDEEVRGLAGLRFTAGAHMVDNGVLDPDNKCYCNGECIPSGLLNLTACRYGAPVFLSFPHFHEANALYLKKVDGLRPDPKKHEFYFTIEPTYGVPIDVGARIQLNMLMQPANHISMYKNVPRMMFPVLWADQRVTITEALARELRMVIVLPTLATVTGVSALTLATILFVVILILHERRKKDEKEANKPC